MTDLFPISNADKISELKRELKQRARVYPRLVEKKTLSQSTADRQCAVLTAILSDYEAGRNG